MKQNQSIEVWIRLGRVIKKKLLTHEMPEKIKGQTKLEKIKQK